MAKYKYYYKNITYLTEDVINYFRDNPKIAEKQYLALIKSRKDFKKEENDETYYEKHHIIPRCLGGDDLKSNLITLTYPEHIFAHLCLISIHYENPNYYKLLHAFCMMLSITTRSFNKEKKFSENDFFIDLDVLGKIRKELIENPKKREAQKQKMIKKWKDPEFRKQQSELRSCKEYLNKQSKSTKERWKDPEFRQKVISKNREYWSDPEYKERLSESLKEAWKDPEKRKLWQKNRDTEEYRQTLRNARTEVLSRPEFQEKMKQIRESESYRQHIHDARVKIWENDEYQTIFCKRVQGPDGKVCRSIKEASETFGVPRTTLTDWLRHKPEKGYKFITEDEYQSRKDN